MQHFLKGWDIGTFIGFIVAGVAGLVTAHWTILAVSLLGVVLSIRVFVLSARIAEQEAAQVNITAAMHRFIERPIAAANRVLAKSAEEVKVIARAAAEELGDG